LQEKANELLDNLESKSLSEHETHNIKRLFQILQSKSQDVIIFLNVLMKLSDRVAAARLELEKAIKENVNVAQVKRKLKWLERRLNRFSYISREICHIKYQGKRDRDSLMAVTRDTSSTCADTLLDDDSKQTLKHSDAKKDGILVENALDTKEAAILDIGNIFSLTSLKDGMLSLEDKDCIERVPSPEHMRESNESDGKVSESAKSEMMTKPNMVDKYWSSDHHRFEWTNFMQKLDPMSWHALAISHPDSFLKGDETFPADELSWRESHNLSEVSTFDAKTVQTLHENIRILLQEIVDASVNSVKVNEKGELTSGYQARSRKNFRNRKKTGARRGIVLPYMGNVEVDPYEESPTKLHSRPVSVVLPVVKKDVSKQFPRRPTVWCDLSEVDIPKHSSYLRGTKKGLNEVPLINRKKQNLNKSMNNQGHLSLKQAIGKISVLARCNPVKDELLERGGLKWKRILALLGVHGIHSSNKAVAVDALKALSQLGVSQKEVIDGIRAKVKEETDHEVLYEAGKCVVALGWWDTFAVTILRKALQYGERCLKLDVLDCLINSRNARFVRKTRNDVSKLIRCIEEIVKWNDDDLSFKAALSMGHLCVISSSARDHLYTRLQDPSLTIRAKALETLVRQMNCKDGVIIDTILFQLNNAKNWKERTAAATLLQFIGVKGVTKDDPEKVFDILEKLLWNHPIVEVRAKAAEVINEFGMRQKSIFLVNKRLEDLNEDVRSNAVQMLSSLRMKGEKELKLLLDIVELDSSINVRIQVLKAFDNLKWNDPRVIRSLQEREKGDGILARTAANVLNSLMSIDGTLSAM